MVVETEKDSRVGEQQEMFPSEAIGPDSVPRSYDEETRGKRARMKEKLRRASEQYGGARSHAGGPRTERLAADALHGYLKDWRTVVLVLVVRAGERGLTGQEACDLVNESRRKQHKAPLKEATVRSRLTELYQMGCTYRKGERSNRTAGNLEEVNKTTYDRAGRLVGARVVSWDRWHVHQPVRSSAADNRKRVALGLFVEGYFK